MILAKPDDAKKRVAAVKDYLMCDREYESPKYETLTPESQRHQDTLMRLLNDEDVDWNEVLRGYNSWHDRIVAACGEESYEKAKSSLEKLKSDAVRRIERTITLVLSKTPKQLHDYNSKTKAGYVECLIELPSTLTLWQGNLQIERRRQAQDNMIVLAFALAAYRAEHAGQYPQTLAELAPKYIDTLPSDPFTGQPFRYRKENGGYLLYSVGDNGKDDDGRGRNDYPESVPFEQRTEWDDISLRTPPKS